MVLALFGLLCVPEMAGAEAKEVKTDFVFAAGAGETIQADYRYCHVRLQSGGDRDL